MMALQRTEHPGQVSMFSGATRIAPRPGRLGGVMCLRVLAMTCACIALAMVAGCKAPPTAAAPQQDAGALNRVLEKARPSVYMVIVQVMPDGHRQYVETLLGTAWVVGDGTLATNAHIAEYFEKLEIDPDNPEGGPVQLVVRSLGGVVGHEPRTHVVTGAVVHPGYDDFNKMWDDYMPMNSSTSDLALADLVDMPGSACDVGLLTVTEPDQLAPKLEIASPEELAALRVGDDVGLIGYAAENISAVTLRYPSPKTHKGHISNITDYFGVGRRDGVAGAYLGRMIHHTCSAEGGASGSPMLAANGKVVAVLSAGDAIGTQGGRVPLAGFFFAQRADLVGELVPGIDHAILLQAPRSREWRSTMKRVYAPGRDLFSRTELWFKRETERVAAEAGRSDPAIVSSNEDTLPLGGDWVQSTQTLSVRLQPGTVYMAIAACPELADIDIHVLDSTSGEVIGEDTSNDWYPWALWEADSTDVEIIVSGVSGVEYEFRLYQFP